MIINACFDNVRTTTNVAEAFTQPVDYFSFDDEVEKRPLASLTQSDLKDNVTMLIIGGSGVFGATTWRTLQRIVDIAPQTLPIIIWGMGINDHGRLDRNYPDILPQLERHANVLIGLRDAFYNNYVPCVSCMLRELDSCVDTRHEIGFYVHKILDISLHYPTMSNEIVGDAQSHLCRVLHFMASCEIVVTNTYHGAYWATLLNRKVIVAMPFSNKFLGFKHEPVIIRDIRFLGQVTHLAKSYPQALAECRRINHEFYSRVRSFQRSLGT
jgi:hypothetical protein